MFIDISGSRRCNRIGRFPVQTPIGARPGLGTQPCYGAPGGLGIENVKTQLLTLVQWDGPLDNDQSLPWGSYIAVTKR